MRGISPAICPREGVASTDQIVFALVNRNEGACRRYAIQQRYWHVNKKTRRVNKIQKQRDKGYKRIDKFKSNKAEQQQQRDIAAREAWYQAAIWLR